MASSQGKTELKFADWMATLPESIQSVPLANLAIPGIAEKGSSLRPWEEIDSLIYAEEHELVAPTQYELLPIFLKDHTSLIHLQKKKRFPAELGAISE